MVRLPGSKLKILEKTGVEWIVGSWKLSKLDNAESGIKSWRLFQPGTEKLNIHKSLAKTNTPSTKPSPVPQRVMYSVKIKDYSYLLSF